MTRQGAVPKIRNGRSTRTGWTECSAVLLFLGTWLGFLGPLAPIVMLIGAGGVVVTAPHQVVAGLKRSGPILLIGAIAVLSATWSTAPGVSFRYGLQLAITLVAAAALASSLPLEKLLRVFFLTSLTVMLLCIASGRQGGSPSGPVLIGLLGSKNEMGTLAQLLLCSSACLFFQRGEHMLIKMMSLSGILLGAAILLFGFATGAVLSAFLFAGTAIAVLIGSRLSPGAKLLLVVAVALILLPLLLIHQDLANFWEYFVVDVLHKDVGLTGRDYLWAHADSLIAQRPLLGYGYRSTWLGTGADTIGLLRWAGLSTGAGFNFHDSYRELAVDFGWLGAITVCICMAVGFVRVIKQALSPGVTTGLVFFAATAVVFVVRAKVEVVMGPFNSSTIIVASTAVVGYLQGQAARVPSGRRRRFRFDAPAADPAPEGLATRPGE